MEGHPSWLLVYPLFQLFVQALIKSLISSHQTVTICIRSCPLHCSIQLCIPRAWHRGRNTEGVWRTFDRGINLKLGPTCAPWSIFWGRYVLKLILLMLTTSVQKCLRAPQHFVICVFSFYLNLRNTELRIFCLNGLIHQTKFRLSSRNYWGHT